MPKLFGILDRTISPVESSLDRIFINFKWFNWDFNKSKNSYRWLLRISLRTGSLEREKNKNIDHCCSSLSKQISTQCWKVNRSLLKHLENDVSTIFAICCAKFFFCLYVDVDLVFSFSFSFFLVLGQQSQAALTNDSWKNITAHWEICWCSSKSIDRLILILDWILSFSSILHFNRCDDDVQKEFLDYLSSYESFSRNFVVYSLFCMLEISQVFDRFLSIHSDQDEWIFRP